MIGRALVGLIAASAVGVGFLAVAGPAPVPLGPGDRRLPVTGSEAVCGGLGQPAKVSAFVAAADLVDGSGTGGVTLSTRGATLKSIPAGGTALEPNSPGAVSPVSIRATGSAAAGLAAVRSQVFAGKGAGRGYLLQPCTAPSPDTWFMGGHTTLGRTTSLELVNPDPTAAQVDVILYGPAGPIDAPGGRGVVLNAYADRSLSLTALAPDVPVVAVEVRAGSGRVAASAFDAGAAGLKSLGMTALQPTTPGYRQLVPGIPSQVAGATLQLLAPGSAGANVHVQLLTAQGQFTPVGGGAAVLQPGHVVSLDLTKGLAGQAAAVLVTSSQPVVVGVRFQTAVTSPGPQVAALVAAPGLTTPALVPGLGARSTGLLHLAAESTAGRVSVAVWRAGEPAPDPARIVSVPAGRQVEVGIPTQPSGWWTLVVRPVDGGPVSAALQTTTSAAAGSLLAAVPLAGLRQILELPEAHLDLGVAQP